MNAPLQRLRQRSSHVVRANIERSCRHGLIRLDPDRVIRAEFRRRTAAAYSRFGDADQTHRTAKANGQREPIARQDVHAPNDPKLLGDPFHQVVSVEHRPETVSWQDRPRAYLAGSSHADAAEMPVRHHVMPALGIRDDHADRLVGRRDLCTCGRWQYPERSQLAHQSIWQVVHPSDWQFSLFKRRDMQFHECVNMPQATDARILPVVLLDHA